MKIIITGGLGFIGHHLCSYLSERGDDVVSIDNFYHQIKDDRHNNFVDRRVRILKEKNVYMESVDTRDTEKILSILHSHRPDIVIHLAATANAEYCNRDHREAVDMGFMSFYSMLSALKEYGKAIHVVFLSSSMVYGNFTKPVAVESDPVEPINIYGASKLSCEVFLKCFGKVYGIPWTIIRPSALYGPRCINRRVTQLFIENIFDFKKIKLMGGDSYLDFTDVRDLCYGIDLVLKKPDLSRSEIFNITYGDARRIKDLLPILRGELGDFECEEKSMNASIPRRGTLSVEKIKTLLGFQPTFPIDIGYRDMIHWYKSIEWKRKN